MLPFVDCPSSMKINFDPASSECPDLAHINLATIERRLVDTFRNYSQEHHPELNTDWEVLSLARHYQLNTRLVDWTLSPYVALFFAAEKHPDEDGVIWCVDRKKTRDLYPIT